MTHHAKSGKGMLDHCLIARELPDTSDVFVVDHLWQRVLVIDRTSKEIIWQYGATARKGHQPGFPFYPDVFDLNSSATEKRRWASGNSSFHISPPAATLLKSTRPASGRLGTAPRSSQASPAVATPAGLKADPIRHRTLIRDGRPWAQAASGPPR